MAKGEKAFVALLLGAAVGYAAGILTAPKSGKETREDIKVAAEKLKKDAEAKYNAARADLAKAIDEATVKAKDLGGKGKKELDELVDKAKVAQGKAADVVKAVKDGDSDDKDLQKALKDVKDAKNHLLSYIKRA